jgi:hypothetical protein
LVKKKEKQNLRCTKSKQSLCFGREEYTKRENDKGTKETAHVALLMGVMGGTQYEQKE